MKCRELQFILPLYSDDVLSGTEIAQVSEHLVHCPLCRQKLIDLKELRTGLRAAARPEFPAFAMDSLRNAVAARLRPSAVSPSFQLIGDRRRWLDVWLMPYAVSALTTLILGFTMLWIVVIGDVQPPKSASADRSGVRDTAVLLPYVAHDPAKAGAELTPMEYARSRSDYSEESPSINPKGSLVALTKSLRNSVTDDEVTVVADVYGNGAAEIAEVVEPSSDHTAVRKLQKALESGSSEAAFVPASFDNRSDPIRVVLKIQNVIVNTSLR